MDAEEVVKRVPPHSLEAEQSVIGAMFFGSEAIVAAEEILTKDDFYARQFGILFEAITELNDAGKAVDSVNILKQRIRVIVQLDNDEKEAREYGPDDLKFQRKNKKNQQNQNEKMSKEEMEALKALEKE